MTKEAWNLLKHIFCEQGWGTSFLLGCKPNPSNMFQIGSSACLHGLCQIFLTLLCLLPEISPTPALFPPYPSYPWSLSCLHLCPMLYLHLLPSSLTPLPSLPPPIITVELFISPFSPVNFASCILRVCY